ncbi:pyridoxal phosphate-dependent aminotransferase family protein [uncultured Algibacter sp.]|uniref:aminotransferase class I/II-fold pyridoxal phosphate-dependent enzyme n=1 Tax=uncultured Algibacter sp. TaxID=298659 RepID=UPI00261B01F1|nr:pyridoxal phosphate-dependent aminotransferase family protein [uncultured Algibacter sp.]
MKNLPKQLQKKIEARKANNALRQLRAKTDLVDFSSNDYLGFSKHKTIFKNSHQFLIKHNIIENGSTGSRLLSGNHRTYSIVEDMITNFHGSEAALIYNSGYDANIGFFSSVPLRGDIILYDEHIHASIRDGMGMNHAKSYKFKHNNLESLEQLLIRYSELISEPTQTVYVVTESVFSMDGDTPNLGKLSKLCTAYKALLIVDEAHTIGVFGEHGIGLIQESNIKTFARIITYGKAMGCHGAAILCNDSLKQYLINFSRSFIYTTALPPHSLATIHASYNELITSNSQKLLHENIKHFKTEIKNNTLKSIFIHSNSAIHCCVIPGNDHVKSISKTLQNSGFNVKPILSPTIPEGQERLRFCLHAYNTKKEISEVLSLLATFVA